jgi:class 3 adenylate cyclase/DNA-binding SARP family transcriptional activator/tetratricopeptide (TPR) repeat protein
VEFRVLGPFEVVGEGGALGLGGFRQRAALALLVVRAPEPVSRDRLIDELWGERPPATAAHAVQVYVSGIRKALRLGGDAVSVLSSPAGYQLDVDPERVDARRFERLVGEAQRVCASDPMAARGLFGDALGLWRGAPLGEFGEFEFARLEADRLQEVHAAAVEGIVESRLEGGEHDEVIGQLTGLIAANPLRERPRRLLMLALYRCGRHAEALAAYRDACAALDEIGLQPGPDLRQLEQAILRHDPGLAVSSPLDGAEGATVSPGPSLARDVRGGMGAPAVAVESADRRDAIAPAGQRKVVTALLCDVMSSSEVGEELDPEALQGVLSRCFRELRSVIERHGGRMDRFTGDNMMGVFGIPRVREDDALRAVRAAAEIRERVPVVADELGVALTFRAGLNTGVVLSGGDENLAIGGAVNVAARLGQAAARGEILLGEETLRLVRDAVEVEPLEPLMVKGRSEPVRAVRLMTVDPLAPGLKRHFEVPLVDRERELGVLRGAWERTVDESGCHLFTLLGDAGVGKSRLVAELLDQVAEDAMVLSGRCLHYGEGITFWPLLEALTAVGEPARQVLDRLSSGGVAVPEELFLEVRRLLEALATDRPVILHIDDLQWGQPMLIDLLDHTVDLSRGAPILVLCSARPELLDERPGWGGGKLNATTVLLEPLDTGDCERLLDQLGDGLHPDARARVIAASEGNPLFLEEMAALTRERGTVAVPSTIQSLLAARLERLPHEERELLKRGAIEGEVFHRSAVGVLAGEQVRADLESRLAALVRKELIRPHSSTFQNDQAFRFRHLLVRDAAYDSVPKAIRTELHERFASWLEDNVPELAELDEIAGWHLEQTIHYQHELCRHAEPAVARRAAQHLHAAGRRAGQRSDPAAARNLLERAHRLAPGPDALRARIGVDLAEQLIEGAELARVDELLAVAERNDETAAPAQLIRLQWSMWAGTEDDRTSAELALPRLIAQLAGAGEERALANAHLVGVHQGWLAGRFAAANEQARLAAEHARRAGDDGLRSKAIGYFVGGLITGPESAETMADELAALESEQLGAYAETFIHLAHGVLARLSGDFPEARQLMRAAIDRFMALGINAMAGGCFHELAPTELQAGHPERALAALREGDAILAGLGEVGFRSTTQAMLALIHSSLGDHEAARRALELAEHLGDPKDALTQSMTNAVRARLALAAGDAEAAERCARTAVEYASRMDCPVAHGDAELELGRVIHAQGNTRDALEHARAALELFTAKGDRPRLRQATAALTGLYDDAL